MGGLAVLVEARIQAADNTATRDEDDPEDSDPFRARADESERDRARRQLKLADAVVTGVLEREIALFERTTSLLSEFQQRSAQGADGAAPESITLILGGEEPSRFESLLSLRRAGALKRLLNAWDRGVRRARERIETDAG